MGEAGSARFILDILSRLFPLCVLCELCGEFVSCIDPIHPANPSCFMSAQKSTTQAEDALGRTRSGVG